MAIRLGTAPGERRADLPGRAAGTLGSSTVLSDRFYLARRRRRAHAGARRRVPVHPVRPAHPGRGRVPDGRVRQRRLARPGRAAELDDQRGAWPARPGILIAPISPLTPITYTLFVVPALAAAVVGRFQHLLPTVLAGLAIGMLQSEAIIAGAASTRWMPQTGAAELVPLIVILVALLVVRPGDARRAAGSSRQPLGRAPRPRWLLVPDRRRHGRRRRRPRSSPSGIVAGRGHRHVHRRVIALSLVVVTGYAGQVSLAQLAAGRASAASR